jgi:protein-tyrosine phosphatase
VTPETYRILMVCSGNICRSPVMERLLVARLGQRLPVTDAARFVITSGGTWGMVGEPMSAPAAASLVALGGDPAGFTGRDLEVEALLAVDLILTAAGEHCRLIAAAAPQVVERTTTLRSFAAALDAVTAGDIDAVVTSQDPVERMEAIAAEAFTRLRAAPFANQPPLDVPDPYGRDDAAYRLAATQIEAALGVLVDLLAPGL